MGERFYQRYVDATNARVDLLCVGGPQDGRRLSVPTGQRTFSMAVNATEIAEYRVATIATYDGDYSFLTPADWTDAQAFMHLFGSPVKPPIA